VDVFVGHSVYCIYKTIGNRLAFLERLFYL